MSSISVFEKYAKLSHSIRKVIKIVASVKL